MAPSGMARSGPASTAGGTLAVSLTGTVTGSIWLPDPSATAPPDTWRAGDAPTIPRWSGPSVAAMASSSKTSPSAAAARVMFPDDPRTARPEWSVAVWLSGSLNIKDRRPVELS